MAGDSELVRKPAAAVESSDPSLWTPTRRTVLAGAAATGIIPLAQAAVGTINVRYKDATRRALLIEDGVTVSADTKTLCALKIDGDLFGASAKFVLRRTLEGTETKAVSGWSAEIDGLFPGNVGVSAKIVVSLIKPDATDAKITIRLTLKNDRNPLELICENVAARLGKPDEDPFLESADNKSVVSFLSVVLGTRLGLNKPGAFCLALDNTGLWTARALAGAAFELRTGHEAQANQIIAHALMLRFAVFNDENPNGAEPRNQLKTPRSELRTLFDNKEGVRSTQVNDGSERKSQPVRVLYARAEGSERAVGGATIGAWGPSPGGIARLEARSTKDGRVVLGWRRDQAGECISAISLDCALVITRNVADETVFEPLRGTVWSSHQGAGSRIEARLEPRPGMSNVMAAARFAVAPLPASAPRPGAISSIPAIAIGGTSNGKGTELLYFSAPLALTSASVPLADSPDAFAALTFDEAECLFHIAGISLRASARVKGAEPPRAEVVIDLGHSDKTNPVARLSLDRAALALRRARDLISLDYRFQGMILEARQPDPKSALTWRVTPDRALAAFARYRVPPEASQVPLAAREGTVVKPSPAAQEDPRPLMVVTFPPQHIAEQALFKRLAADPALPAPPPGTQARPAEFAVLLYGALEDRKKKREDIAKRQQGTFPTNEQSKFFHEFCNAFASQKLALPDDQKIYIGEAFLDPRAMRVARSVARGIAKNMATSASATSVDIAFELRGLPEVELSSQLIDSLRLANGLPLTRDQPVEPLLTYDLLKDQVAKTRAYLGDREAAKARQDYDYRCYRRLVFSKATNATAVKEIAKLIDDDACDTQIAAAIADPENKLKNVYLGRDAAVAAALLSNNLFGPKSDRLLDVWTLYDRMANERFDGRPLEARVSGRSRLAFRIPANDFDTGDPDSEGHPAGSFAFSLRGLTNWGAYDLAVVRRAEKVFDPAKGIGGREPQRWNRTETLNEAAKLLHLGLSRGDRWAIASDEGQEDKTSLILKLAGTSTGRRRMTEVAETARAAPRWNETAIEMPFRLMLSPAQDANWLTPMPINVSALTKDLKKEAQKIFAGLMPAPELAVPLWHARLDEAPGSSSLRAIWSPDFRPEALYDDAVGAPLSGPFAPWAMPRGTGARRPLSALNSATDSDKLPPASDKLPPASDELPKLERFRTSMDAYDRHELVLLSGVHGLPVRGRRTMDGSLVDGSQMEPPPGFRLRDAAIESLSLNEKKPGEPADRSAIYRPRALGARELTLTALGGSFEAETDFVPPVSAKVLRSLDAPRDSKIGEAHDLYDALSIERWRHSAVIGRDIKVELVYKGYLFPFGHRASLVKTTERRFLRIKPGGAPYAVLVQRFFLRVGEPEKRYPALGQADGGRRWPAESIDILTRVTPDILDPSDAAASLPSDPSHQWSESSNGRIWLFDKDKALPGRVFWPRTRHGVGGEVTFEFQMDRRGARLQLPLIFLDNTAANNSASIAAVCAYYETVCAKQSDGQPSRLPWDEAGTPRSERRRLIDFSGAKRRYASEIEPDDTSFDTLMWQVSAEGRLNKPFAKVDKTYAFDNSLFDFGSVLQGAEQPPFYPVMRRTLIRVGQIDRLVGGRIAPVTARFDEAFQAFGFPRQEILEGKNEPGSNEAKYDVYLAFERGVQFEPGAAGDRTGGATRPSSYFIGLSRSMGPIGATPPEKNTQSSSTTATPSIAPANTQPLDNASDLVKPADITSVFDLNAKILGILTFKDALTLIGVGLAAMPAFREVTQYTSALVDDAEAEGSAIINKVRDTLLLPLRNALNTLIEQFGASLNQPGNAEETALTLRRLYPQVAAGYADLDKALDAAIKTSASVSNIALLLAEFSAIYTAGRRFLAAIEQAARDPLAQVKQSLKDAFSAIANGLIGAVEKNADGIAAQVKGIVEETQKHVVDLLTNEGLAEWRRLVFALPSTTDDNDAEKVYKAAEKALAETLSGAAFFVELRKAHSDIIRVANVLSKAVAEKLSSNSDAIIKEAGEAFGKVATGAGKDIQGLLFAHVMTQIGLVLAAADSVATLATQGSLKIENMVPRLSELVSAASALSEFDLQAAKTSADDACKALLTPLFTFAQPFVSNQITDWAIKENNVVELNKRLINLLNSSTNFPKTEFVNMFFEALEPRVKRFNDTANNTLRAAMALGSQAQKFSDLVQTQSKPFDPVVQASAICSAQLPSSALTADQKKTLDLIQSMPRLRDDLLRNARELVAALANLPFSIVPAGNPANPPKEFLEALTGIKPGTKYDQLDIEQRKAINALREAVQSAVNVAVPLADMIIGITSIPAAADGKPDVLSQLDSLVGQNERQALDVAKQSREKIGKAKKFASKLKEFDPGGTSDGISGIETLASSLSSIADSTTGLRAFQATVLDPAKELADAQRRLMAFAARGIALAGSVRVAMADSLSKFAKPATLPLALALKELVYARNKLAGADGSGNGTSLSGLGSIAIDSIKAKLVVPVPSVNNVRNLNQNNAALTIADDFLVREYTELQQLSGVGSGDSATDAAHLAALFADWSKGQSSPQLLVRQINMSAQDVLSGQLARVVDLQAARKLVEAKLKEMIPSKVSLALDFKAEMKKLGELFLPKQGSQLTLVAGGSYDLLIPASPPKFTATATIDAFDINLFDVVTFMFDGIAFTNDDAGSHFDVHYNDFKMGPKAAFLQPLQELFNPSGSGPYIQPLRGSPGIEAGYSLALDVIPIGPVSFSNVSLNAFCRLPFDNRAAIFGVSLGRRDKPVLISCLPYTGGGSIGLIATSKGILGFEASFEFGGGGAFKAGPLMGQGRLSLGIFVRQVQAINPGDPQGCQIDGFFYAGGEAHLACFSIAASLVVTISQQPGGEMYGMAVFTFSFSVGIADVHYRCEFVKTEGKGFSGSKSQASLPWPRYAANGDVITLSKRRSLSGAELCSDTSSQAIDWQKHRAYFANDIDGFPA